MKSKFTYFVDMDGVLTDLQVILERAIAGSWLFHGAFAAAIGDPQDEQRVYDFYMTAPKLPEADRIWRTATEAGGAPPSILTAIPCDVVGLERAKWDWIVRHLDPLPARFLTVPHRTKGKFARSSLDVLVDDMHENIQDWTAAEGTGILHKPGEFELIEPRLLNPAA